MDSQLKNMPQRTQSKKENFLYKELTNDIISCAINVHSILGPGLLESLYEEALIHEFELNGILYERQKEIDFIYKNKIIGKHRIDLIADDKVLLELKAVNEIHPIHQAQILSYLRATNIKIGLLINFNVNKLKDGIKRFII